MDLMIQLPNAPILRQRRPIEFLKIQFYAHINQKKADIVIPKFKRSHRWEKIQETQQLNATQDLDWIEQQQQN